MGHYPRASVGTIRQTGIKPSKAVIHLRFIVLNIFLIKHGIPFRKYSKNFY